MSFKRVFFTSRAIILLLTAAGYLANPYLAGACPCAFDASSPYISAANTAMQNKDYAGAKSALLNALKYDKQNPNIIYNLALAYLATGDYDEAKKNMIKAMDVLISTYGSAHRQVAQGYLELGDLCENEAYETNKPELRKKTAEYYSKSVDLCEKIYTNVSYVSIEHAKNSNHKHSTNIADNHAVCKIDAKQAALDLSAVLRHTADFFATDDNFTQAEPMYKRSLDLEQLMLGANTKQVYEHKAKLAQFYCEESKQDLALPLFKEALESSQKDDPESHQTVQILYNFGNLYRDENKLQEAESLLKQCFEILSKSHQKDEMELAETAAAFVDVLDKENKPDQANEICTGIVSRLKKGDDKNALLLVLKQYHKHFLLQHKKDEADKVASEIKALSSNSGQQ